MEMNITLYRRYLPQVTVGNMYISGVPNKGKQLSTIELPWKNNKKGESCIAEGEYILELHRSPSKGECLKVKMPNGSGVLPGNRQDVLVHVANYTKELLGCIAPGLRHGDINHDGIIDVGDSIKALDFLLTLFKMHGIRSAKLKITTPEGYTFRKY